MCEFVGREKELEIAKRLLNQNSSRIMVIHGKRRVGKTALAEKIAEGYRFFKFSGISPKESNYSAETQINNFIQDLSKQTGHSYEPCPNWHSAFSRLEDEIPDNEKTVVLFDEISWMAQGDPTFVGVLKNWWDLYIYHHKNILLIFCGSISTWIEKNIINSSAFYGRISAFINLQPLSIIDSAKLLRSRNFQGSPYEFYQLLSTFGGIPWYLEQIDPHKSPEQNILDLCFNSSGLLYNEFEHIFNDIFYRYGDIYHRILDLLVDGPKDLAEIREALDYPRGGQLGILLDNLVVAGFIAKHKQWSIKTCTRKKKNLYRICDPYTRFYLKCSDVPPPIEEGAS